jgi:hypothetical protein
MLTSALRPPLARLPFNPFMTITLLLKDGGRLAPMAVDLVDRLAILLIVRRFPSMGAADSRSLRSESYARMKEFVRRFAYVPFRRFLGDVRREFIQRLSVALHGTLGFCPRDAL